MRLFDFVGLLRSVDRLLSLEDKHNKAIETLELEIDRLKARVTRIEAREDIVVVEARGAAAAAASALATHSISDMARRIGALEERSARGRLKSPPSP